MDEEHEWVTFTTEFEFSECLKIKKFPVIKIKVTKKSLKRES